MSHRRAGRLGPRGLPAPPAGRLFATASAALARPRSASGWEVAGIDPGAPSTSDSTRAFLEVELAKSRDMAARRGCA